MAVLSKCVVGSSLVQLALGAEGVEEVTLSKLSDIKQSNWKDIHDEGTLTVGSKTNPGQKLSDIMEQKGSEDKYVLKDYVDPTVCGKFREFKDGVFKSNQKEVAGKDTVYTIDFKVFTFDDKSEKTLTHFWDECMRTIAQKHKIAVSEEVSMLKLNGAEPSIAFIEKIWGLTSETATATIFSQLFGKSTTDWVSEKQKNLIHKPCTKEEFVSILESNADIWNGKRATIFNNMDLAKDPATDPAPTVITIDEQQDAIAQQVAKEIKAKANTDPVGIDIMKSKGLLALLVSGLFMTACNFAWNFYQWKLKASSDVDNEEDDSTDAESDE